MKLNYVTKKELEIALLQEGVSINQLAKDHGCSWITMRDWIREYGIEYDHKIAALPSQAVRKLFLNKTKLTDRQISIVVGTILGDGSIQKNRGGRNAYLATSQCARRKAYVEWKAKELRPFVTRSLRKAGTIAHPAYIMDTVYHEEFTFFFDMFRPVNRKIVPSNIGDYLDELALAVWYMDDGSLNISRRPGVTSSSSFATCAYTDSECEILLGVLRDKFGIEGCRRSQKDNKIGKIYNLLYIYKENHLRLHDIIDPLLHKCFEYKKLPFDARQKILNGREWSRGEKHYMSKLTDDIVRHSRILAAQGIRHKDIAERYGVARCTISRAINGERWGHVISSQPKQLTLDSIDVQE